jgi:manganese efflux pump family protein
MVRIVALIIPLALDTLAVSAAIGIGGATAQTRRRLSLVFAAFEGVMPLVGFLLGRIVGGAVGETADVVAALLLIGVGVHLLLVEDDEAEKVREAATVRGWHLISLGLSVSLDELAIGFTIGLLGLPILIIVVVIAAQAFIAAQIGYRLGARMGEEVAEWAERIAAFALIILGAILVIQQVF